MKKLLLPLSSILLLTACQKQVTDEILQQKVADAPVNKSSPKFNICHFNAATSTWETISISPTAWPAHQVHGDVRLDDQDGDGYVPNNACGYGTQGDCNDNNVAINPGVTEVCNGVDDDCDGLIDEGVTTYYRDADGDGYGNAAVTIQACSVPSGYVSNSTDCNDANAAINPGATEICGNNIDENCNGMSDDVCSLSIGDSYQGGKIAYILQSGDPGYVANETHGLIAAPSDHSTLATWGCDGTELSGADGTAIGTGNQNTIDIMAGCTEGGIAARICGELILGGYNDWYLPSIDELHKLYINRVAVGGFASGVYWSSSESGNTLAVGKDFSPFPGTVGSSKSSPYRVRSVRAF